MLQRLEELGKTCRLYTVALSKTMTMDLQGDDTDSFVLEAIQQTFVDNPHPSQAQRQQSSQRVQSVQKYRTPMKQQN